jgi:ribosome-associated translation inhibitor RaiA
MTMHFELRQKDVTLTPGLAAALEERAGRLDRFHPHLQRCRITVEGPGGHHRQGRYRVRIDLVLRGAEIVIQKHAEANLELALKDAFQAAARRLEDQARRSRGMVKTPATP